VKTVVKKVVKPLAKVLVPVPVMVVVIALVQVGAIILVKEVVLQHVKIVVPVDKIYAGRFQKITFIVPKDCQ
jgi:hypothetical protein